MKIIVISGTSAGIGKTTLSIGLMAALEQRGLRVQAFKVGPDFNDPLRHERAINRPSHSLDGTMLTKEYNISTVAKFSSECDVAIVDGLDGLFDGYDPNSENGSTAQMAKWLKAPVILVCDCDSMARSIAAVTRGYQEFDTELTIAGVVFNKVGSLKHAKRLSESMKSSNVNVVMCGAVPKDTNLLVMNGNPPPSPSSNEYGGFHNINNNNSSSSFTGDGSPKTPSSTEDFQNPSVSNYNNNNHHHYHLNSNAPHQGASPNSKESIALKIQKIAKIFENTVDIDAILALAKDFSIAEFISDDTNFNETLLTCATSSTYGGRSSSPAHTMIASSSSASSKSRRDAENMLASPSKTIRPDGRVRIAVARDDAFCFFYPENLNLLERAGAELVFFSPVAGDELPRGIAGVIFPGGYPECHADALTNNRPLRMGVTAFASSGGVVYGESGGLMFLSQSLTSHDSSKPRYMCGLAPFATRFTRTETRGYLDVRISIGNPLFPPGEVARGQTLHHYEIVGEIPQKIRSQDDTNSPNSGWRATYDVKPTSVEHDKTRNDNGEGGVGHNASHSSLSLERTLSNSSLTSATMIDNNNNKNIREGFAWNNVLVSNVHLHFGGNPKFAASFVKTCKSVKAEATIAAQKAATAAKRLALEEDVVNEIRTLRNEGRSSMNDLNNYAGGTNVTMRGDLYGGGVGGVGKPPMMKRRESEHDLSRVPHDRYKAGGHSRRLSSGDMELEGTGDFGISSSHVGNADGPFANHSHALTEVQNNLSGALNMFKSRSMNLLAHATGAHKQDFSMRSNASFGSLHRIHSQADLLNEKEMSSRSNFGTSGDDAYNSMKRGHYHAPALVKVPEPDSEGYICSLSPAATEMVYALGLEHRLVGITSECDYPKGVQRAHSVMTSLRSINEAGNVKSHFFGAYSSNKSTHSSSGFGSSYKTDASGHSGPNNMEININMLRSSNAKIILAPDVCESCLEESVDPRSTVWAIREARAWREDIQDSAHSNNSDFMGHRADEFEDNDMKGVLPIAPHTLTDIFEIMLQIGNVACQDFVAERVVKLLRDRLRRVASKVAPGFERRPRVVSLEACKPLISGGHWLPEMKMIAGAVDELQEPGAPAEALRWERILEHQPDVLLINFEGSFEKTLEKIEVLASQAGWWNLNAVKNREVYILNNKIFSRPGPRLVDGVEMLARIFHPDLMEEPLMEGMCLKFNLEAGKKVRPGRLRNFFSPFH